MKKQPEPFQDNSYTRMTFSTASGSVYRLGKDVFDKFPTLQKIGAKNSKILISPPNINVGQKAELSFINNLNELPSQARTITTSTVKDITCEVGIKHDIIATKNSTYDFTPNYDKFQNGVVGYIRNIKFPTPDNTVPVSQVSEIGYDKPFSFVIADSAPEGLAGKRIITSPVEEHRFRIDYEPYRGTEREEPDLFAYQNYGYDRSFDV